MEEGKEKHLQVLVQEIKKKEKNSMILYESNIFSPVICKLQNLGNHYTSDSIMCQTKSTPHYGVLEKLIAKNFLF